MNVNVCRDEKKYGTGYTFSFHTTTPLRIIGWKTESTEQHRLLSEGNSLTSTGTRKKNHSLQMERFHLAQIC